MSHRRDYGGRKYDRRERSPHRSGYGRDDRSSQRYDDRGRGRDPGYRDERSDRGGRGGRGGYGGGRGGRGGSGFDAPQMPTSKLPPLPDSVPIPESGSRVPDTLARPSARDGQPIQVLTNHYPIQSLPIVKIHEYELQFELTPESKRGTSGTDMSPALIEKAFKAASRAQCFGNVSVFNGTSLLWSPSTFVARGEIGEQLVHMPGHTQDRPNAVKITIRNVGHADIRRLVDRFQRDLNLDVQASLVWINALFRNFPASQESWYARPKGLAFFIREPGLYMELPSTNGFLEALRGLHQSVSTHFNILSVNVDIATTAFYAPDKSLKDLAFTFAGLPYRAQPEDLLDANLEKVSQQISGIAFYVTHRGGNQPSMKIKAKGLCFAEGHYVDAATHTFMRHDPISGQEHKTTIQAYFESRYNVRVQYPMLPLVESAKGLFPLEFCKTSPGERYREVLDGKETADFIKFSTSPAFVRSQQIEECVKRLGWHDQGVLSAHGVSVVPKMLQVPAVKLAPPPVQYAQGSEKTSINNGSWNLRNKRFVNPKVLKSWGVLYLTKPSQQGHISEHDIEIFFRNMHSQLKIYGLSPPNGPPVVVLSSVQCDIKSTLKRLDDNTRNRFQCKKSDMLFVLLHDGTSPDHYKAIKTAGEVEFGVPTQVMIVEKSVRNQKGVQQYCANLCMKINAKLGGVNSLVPLRGRFSRGGLMIVGADVTHPTPAQLALVPPPPSIAALTATFDRDCVRYTSLSTPQPSTRESIAAGASMPVFTSMFGELVQRFADRNDGRKPPMVIYFRDGVADSQITELRNGEVKALKESINAHGGKLTAIIVQKRHHTRFFPVGRSNDRNGNVEPGTIVETGPKSSMAVAHGALQGTVRPSHYVVVEDQLDLTKDELHELIMHGTHSYGKATRAVHTHAAIYYADIVAERSTARFRSSGDQEYYVRVNDNLAHTQWWL